MKSGKVGAMELSIRSFELGDGEVFRALNEEWISRYFVMEADDKMVLGDPEEHILRAGGEVFIARVEGKPVGCCALIVKNDGVMELCKMAVAPSYQGRGIGRRLLSHAIEEARERGAKAVVLGSNTRLKDALHLYEALGFRYLEGDEAPSFAYKRANVFMRLDFDRDHAAAESRDSARVGN